MRRLEAEAKQSSEQERMVLLRAEEARLVVWAKVLSISDEGPDEGVGVGFGGGGCPCGLH